MSIKKIALVAAAACACAVSVGTYSFAGDDKMPEMPLPPGWTAEDMQKCTAAGTPGEMQVKLHQMVGTWKGTNEMWMVPGMPGMKSEQTWEITDVYDGRYTKIHVSGEMPGMGKFDGMGFTGFDNVSKKVVSTWLDTMSTGIMYGEGEFSTDGKSLTLNYKVNCPITEKAVPFRQVQHFMDANTVHVEFYGTDPKTGSEYKCMESTLKRQH